MTAVGRLAVYGGSFDPVHAGHLAIARAALASGAADRVLFVPARVQPLKLDARPAPGAVRAEMLAAATSGEPRFAVSTLELERPGPSYTLDTLRALRQQQPHAHIVFLCGADQLANLPRWHRPHDVLAEFGLLVAERPGQPLVEAILARLAAAGFTAELLARVEPLAAPLHDISATAIRERIRRGEPVAGLVPDAVAAIIARHGLYRG